MSDKDKTDEPRQEQFRLARPVGGGEDENGPYQVIPLSMVKGGKLKPTKVHTDPVKHVINDSNPTPRGWYKDKHEPPSKRPRPCASEALLTTPYGGACHINCRFCYVGHGTRGYRATGIATASPRYPDMMRDRLKKMSICPAAYISSFTEPFQHLEARYHIVERLSQVLTDEGLPLFYLTRLIPPEWAVDALLQNSYSYMQWSINTPNEKHRRLMSPGTAPLDDVFKSMQTLSEQGIYISIQVNPVLPGITTLDELVDLVHDVAEFGGNHVIFKFAEQVYSNRKLLLSRLSRLPNVDKFDSLLSQKIGGVYTIAQDVRIEWLKVLLQETRKAGITMSTCYEYYADGTQGGANLAPWFTTSRGGCHGQAVPMFYRPEVGAKFEPLPGCFESGCLYCEEHGTMACRNDDLLEAKALKYADYRAIRLAGSESRWSMAGSAPRPGYVPDYDYWYLGQQTFADHYEWGQPW